MFNLKRKRYVVFGVANEQSICFAIAKYLAECGAEIVLGCHPTVERRSESLAAAIGPETSVIFCDVSSREDVATCFEMLGWSGQTFNGMVHGIAYSDRNQLRGQFTEVTAENFRATLDVSAYSFIELAREMRPLLVDGGSILTLTFDGARGPYPHYNVMGVAKAALESAVRYLAFDFGEREIRVNAISASPEDTLSARAIGNFRLIGAFAEAKSPFGRRATKEEIAHAAGFLLSPLASGITGQTLMVDCGSSVPEMPPPRNARAMAGAMAAVADTYDKQQNKSKEE